MVLVRSSRCGASKDLFPTSDIEKSFSPEYKLTSECMQLFYKEKVIGSTFLITNYERPKFLTCFMGWEGGESDQ